MSFIDLNLTLQLRNALTDMGIKEPTPIQARVFPIIMSGRDLVGISQTGTGKTIAYLLPILRQFRFTGTKHPRVLILVPTHELVHQVVDELKKLSTYMRLRVEGVYGGANINVQSSRVYQGTDVLVATPGRLFDLAMRGTLRLGSVQKLVIDEVDEMLGLGFRSQIISILEMLPEKRQNLMFSATLEDDVEEIIGQFFNNPFWVDINFRGTPIERITQYAYYLPNLATKFNLLSLLLEDESTFEKVLIFAHNKKTADKLFNKLQTRYPGQLGVIHSNKSQNQRFNILDKFKSGEIRVLISTDLVARGIDIFEVSHVINYGMPANPSSYIHRIGRTGRLDRNGVAISLITVYDLDRKLAVEKYINNTIKDELLPKNLVISTTEEPEDLAPLGGDKPYLKPLKIKTGGGAFHEKKQIKQKISRSFQKQKNYSSARKSTWHKKSG